MRCHTSVVAVVRVYELASRIGVTSHVLLLLLRARKIPARSASSRLEPNVVADLLTLRDFQAKTEAIKQAGRERRNAAQDFPDWWDRGDDDRPYDVPIWIGPDRLTAAEAGQAVGVTAATIRQWVARGHLLPVGSKGRAHLFVAADVIAVQHATNARLRIPVQSTRSGRRIPVNDRRRGVTSANISELVTTSEAAQSAGVAEATVRSWVRRGLLTPAGRRGRSHLFVRLDVINLARRQPYRPKRKPRHF